MRNSRQRLSVGEPKEHGNSPRTRQTLEVVVVGGGGGVVRGSWTQLLGGMDEPTIFWKRPDLTQSDAILKTSFLGGGQEKGGGGVQESNTIENREHDGR